MGKTVGALKGRGFAGVMLGYAREMVVEEVGKREGEVDAEMEGWKQGTLETVEMAERGDFVALKYASPQVERVRWW